MSNIKNAKVFLIDLPQNQKSVLRNDGTLTPEDRSSWERFAETALVSLMNNPAFHEGRDNAQLVKEASLVADTLLNESLMRFAPRQRGVRVEDEDDAIRSGNTGLFNLSGLSKKCS